MGFIVYNKDMKGYLRKHSGSYRRFRWHALWNIQKELRGKLVTQPSRTETEEFDKFWGAVHKEVSKRVFSATSKDAREYLTRAGALNSIGIHGRRLGDKVRLPDNLEIHKIETMAVKITKTT